MADVRSKNIYALLGNESDQDSDREPDVLPAKTADKPVVRKGKRDAPDAPAPTEPRAPGGERGGRGGRRGGGFSGNDGAFRDRNAGSGANRDKPTDDGIHDDRNRERMGGGRPGNYEGRGRGRGGRGRGGGRGDRQDRSGQGEHQKQADISWGAKTGDAEWNDEQAGEAIAKEEEKGGWDSSAAPAVEGDGEKLPEGEAAARTTEPTEDKEFEPEDNSKSYADYLAEQATKKMSDLGLKEARKPNEGSKADKKWSKAKELKRDEEEDAEYIKGKEEKARRERQRKEKNIVDVDMRFVEPSRGRGDGRGRGRGDRGSGRGDRGSRGGRGRGEGLRGRGDGFRGRDDGGFRGARAGGDGFRGRGGGGSSEAAPVNIASDENFPSLGSK